MDTAVRLRSQCEVPGLNRSCVNNVHLFKMEIRCVETGFFFFQKAILGY